MKGLAPLLCLLGLVAIPTGSALSNTWDPTADFSDVNNPNGAWSYGWMNGSQFQLYSSSGVEPGQTDTTSPAWWGPLTEPDNSGRLYPMLWENTQSPVDGVQTGQLSLQPGPDGEASVVRWTAPIGLSGVSSIQGQFLPGDSGIMQVGVFENGNWASPLWTGTDSGVFDLSVPLTAGDTIDFDVYGGFYEGNTPLEATIMASVPEPSTFVLLGVGAIWLLGYALRRRKRAA